MWKKEIDSALMQWWKAFPAFSINIRIYTLHSHWRIRLHARSSIQKLKAYNYQNINTLHNTARKSFLHRELSRSKACILIVNRHILMPCHLNVSGEKCNSDKIKLEIKLPRRHWENEKRGKMSGKKWIKTSFAFQIAFYLIVHRPVLPLLTTLHRSF